VLPGGVNPEQPLPINILSKSRRLPSGVSPVRHHAGLGGADSFELLFATKVFVKIPHIDLKPTHASN
jgi:hypothetical protein